MARIQVEQGLRALDPVERFLITRLYFGGGTEAQVASEVGKSKNEVHLTVVGSLATLRVAMAVDSIPSIEFDTALR